MDVLSPFISVILVDSSTGSPVHVLIRLRADRYLFLQATLLFPHGVTIVC